MQEEHDAVLDDLAALIDGDEQALARHAEHLAACDACRDARHEAAEVARGLKAAGADHVAPADLEARVMAAIDKEVVTAPTPSAPVAKPKQPQPAEVRPIGSARSRRTTTIVLLAAAAIAAGGLVAMKMRGGSDAGDRTATPTVAGTRAEVARIQRASTDGVVGLLVRGPGEKDFRPVEAGGSIAAGSLVRTDDRTRAQIVLDDGSTLSLDHGTELVLDAASPRQVQLIAGLVVADVAHVDGAPLAGFVTPTAKVEVLGTRFVLTATAATTSVRVTRGAVRLGPAVGDGKAIEVRAGEEGTLGVGGLPEVAAVPSLGDELSWAELLGDAAALAGADEVSAGLGALRAYKPGEQRDRDWKLTLSKHKVTVRMVGPIARTEIEETFRNDTDSQLEGVYQFPLPADSRIDSLALDVPGGFEEGAFIDRERATRIWAGVIDRATPRSKPRPPQEMIWVPGPWRDPALLEWQRGGRFELKIFPIPAHGERTIKIAYTQVLAPHGDWRRYVYPLPHGSDGSTAAEQFTLDVKVASTAVADVRSRGYDLTSSAAADDAVLTFEQKGFVPRGDLVIEQRPAGGAAELRAWTFAGAVAVAPDDKKAKRAGKSGRDLGLDPAVLAAQRDAAADVRPAVVLALRPELPRWQERAERDYVIVVDASQSMVGERHTRAVDLAAAMIGELDRRDRFTILSCDTACRQLPGGIQSPSAKTAGTASAWLATETAAGASDVVATIRAGLSAVPRDPGREAWVIYVGDGFATTGFRRAGDVETLVAEAAKLADARVTTVGIGSDADTTLLSAVARGGGGNYVAWVPGQQLGTAALSALETTYGTALRDATVELPAGITDSAPTRLPTIRAGEEILVAGRFTGEVSGEVVLRGTVGGTPFVQRYPIALKASTAPGNAFVPRVWAALAIDELERVGRGEDRARIVGLSQGFGVLSRHTSLLVLESEAMFEAFGVDRGAPRARWTGDEDLDEVSSDGTVAYDDGLDQVATRSPGKAPTASGRGAGGGYKDSAGAVADDDVTDPFAKAKKTGKADAPEKKKEPAEVAAKPDPRRAPRDRSGGQWMRKVWFRVGAVTRFDGVSQNILDAIGAADAALAAMPDSRERHRALVQALSYAGDLDRAYRVASAWLERDRLDPQALGYMADILGRQGRRDDALRLLGGVVDLEPDDVALHQRLATAHERAGRTAPACSHRIAITAIRDDDAAAAGAAMRCLRTLGRDGDAALVRRGLATDILRERADKASAADATGERATGDLVISAHWTGGADLDLTLVTPQGTRVSWMGGRTDLGVVDAATTGQERLGLRRLKKGRYLVEVSRTRAGDTTPVHGTVEVTVLGVTRTLTFDLDGDREVVGRVAVSMQSRLEPVE